MSINPIHPLQAMIDGMNAQSQRERATAQMTLGGLIDRLETLAPDSTIEALQSPHSYRGYYCDLALKRGEGRRPVAALLTECKAAMGEVFEGYKGGDYVMGRNTPVWVANRGCCGQKLMAVRDDGSLELADDT